MLRHWLHRAGIGAGLAAMALVALLLATAADLPPISTLKDYRPALITKVYDRKGRLLTEFAAERREIVELKDVPLHVREAFLAAEDDRFYEHFGVEPLGIVRAVFKNLAAGRKAQGASTITQQVARSFFLTQKRTYTRKLKEILLALKLEANLSKDEILFLYLNQIYFGRGAYGIGAAADVYFGKTPRDLTVAEAALIAGLPPAPSRYAPHAAPEKARERQLYVLRRMRENNWLDEASYAAAVSESVLVRRWSSPFWQAPWAAEAVRRWLLDRFPEDTVMRGGLVVYTTIDLDLSRAAQRAVMRGLEDLDKRQGYRGPVTHAAQEEWDAWRAALASQVRADIDRSTGGGVEVRIGTAQLPAASRPVTDDLSPDLVFSGLVTGFSADGVSAWVDFGAGVGRLGDLGMYWARVPDPTVSSDEDIVRRARDRLRVGDVIRVRRLTVPDDAPDWIAQRIKAVLDAETKAPGPLLLALEQSPEAQGSLLAMDPHDGGILAVVGGYDFASNQFNRALQARRQPGSAFKPIVYSAALDAGYTPASILVDTPVVYEDAEREFRWKPKNYEGKFYGPMTLVDALTFSRNVVTIQLVRQLGVATIAERARALGIESPLPADLSMALGSGAVTPLELLRAYATFAAGGRRPEPALVREVWDSTGAIVYKYVPPVTETTAYRFAPFTEAPVPRALDVPFGLVAADPVSAPVLAEFPEVISPETAFQMTYLLRNVVERGTGWRARALGRPVAGKTGTTDENVDSWFAGYTPQLAAVVWVGFDQQRELGKFETGARAALPIWTNFMIAAHRGLPVAEFEVPPGIIWRSIDAQKGTPATPLSQKTLLVPFREGTEPGSQEVQGAPAGGQGGLHELFDEDFLHRTTEW